MKKIALSVFGLLLICQNAIAQSFEATVNRNVVPEGETFVLTLDLKDVDSSKSPDLSTLNQDFMVLSVSNGFRTNIVNSKVSKSRQWSLVLIPKKTGEITISEIELEGYKTNPITIKVLPSGEEPLVKSEDINSAKFKITGEVNNNNPYVQQQINYQIKIEDIGGLQGNAPYFNVSNDDWIIKLIGEPKVENTITNGQNIREITFDYALFPLKSGELTIPPAQFSGYYLTKSVRTDPFARFFEEDPFFAGIGMNTVFANKNAVVLNTKPIKVNVKPAIAGVNWWLPAKEVKLSAEFNDPKPQFKVGEPVSRTIYMTAVGVLDTNLPEIEFTSVDGVKQYPEKPINEMSIKGGEIVSSSKISNVYIPSKTGEVTLPKIDVKWFNTNTDEFEIASIPEYKINVGGIMPATTSEEQKFEPTALPSQEKPVVETVEKVDNAKTIYLLIVAFFGGVLVALILTKLLTKIALRPNNKKTIIEAAKARDLKLLRDELIIWGQKHFPSKNIANLQDVADIFDSPAFNRELDKIRETLYANTEKDWDEKTFLEVFCNMCKSVKKHRKNQKDPLPKLYK